MKASAKSSSNRGARAPRPVHPDIDNRFDPQPRLQLLTVQADRRIPLPGHLLPTGLETRHVSRVATRH